MTVNPETLDLAARACWDAWGGPAITPWNDISDKVRDNVRRDIKPGIDALAAAGWLRDTPEATR